MEFFIIFSKGGLLLWEHNFHSQKNEDSHRREWINQFLKRVFLHGMPASSAPPSVLPNDPSAIEPTFVISYLEFRWLLDHSNGLVYLIAYPAKFPLRYAADLLEDTRLLFPNFHESKKEAFFTLKFDLLFQKYANFSGKDLRESSFSGDFPISSHQSNSSVNNFADDEQFQGPTESIPASPNGAAKKFLCDPQLGIAPIKSSKGGSLKPPGKASRTWEGQVSKREAASLDFTTSKV